MGAPRAKRVLFALYAHPAAYPPVERAALILRERGWTVRMIGAGGMETDALADDRLRALGVSLVPRDGEGAVQKLQYCRFLVVCISHLLWWRPDWVHVSDGMATPFGLVARLAGFRVLYHEHDTPSVDAPSAFMRAVLRARHALLRRAQLAVTPNEERSTAASAAAGGREVLTVWNCPLREEILATPEGARSGPPRVVFHGSVVPARLPLSLVDALAMVPGIELEISGYETIGSRGYLRRLRDRAEELGVGARLHIHPPLPRRVVMARAAMCDLGLALLPADSADFNERAMAGASNKAFEYLACGVPILVPDTPSWRRSFVDRGVAFACDPADARSIAAVFQYAVAHRDELARRGAQGRALIAAEWNYETRFRVVEERLESALATVFTEGSPSHAS